MSGLGHKFQTTLTVDKISNDSRIKNLNYNFAWIILLLHLKHHFKQNNVFKHCSAFPLSVFNYFCVSCSSSHDVLFLTLFYDKLDIISILIFTCYIGKSSA